MDVVVNPGLDETGHRALLLALERAEVRPGDAAPRAGRWWQAGLDEAVDRDGRDDDYAFSPRSTRGATRA